MNFFSRTINTILAVWMWTALGALAIATPPDQQTASQPTLGKSIYEVHCAPCHGTSGKGDGVASALLNPRPRNLTTGMFKFRSTESGSLPTDEDLTATISNGLHGRSMPDWAPFIKGDSFKKKCESSLCSQGLDPRWSSSRA
jgi:cytochrome c oxidase cbb3-type subunit 2